jgi:2'-5' RNA ligase
VVWIGIARGMAELSALAGTVDRALAPLGFPPEARAFTAHVTLGRVRSPKGLDRLAAAIGAVERLDVGAWTGGEVVLYRSHLRPTGAVYEALERLPLRGR